MPEPTTVAEEIAGRDRPYALRGPEPAVAEAEPPTVMPEVNGTAPMPAPPAPPAAPAPPAVVPALRDTSQADAGLQDVLRRRRDLAERQAGAIKPQIASVLDSLNTMSSDILQRATAAQPPETPAPPKLGLHDFLQPTKDESPENAIGKVIQALGLIGGGFRGMMRGDATAALASMRGALQGWQEGDKARADRAFTEWEATSKRLTENWQRQQEHIRTILGAANLTLGSKKAAMELQLLADGVEMEPLKIEQQGLEYMVGRADRFNETMLKYLEHMAKIQEMKREADQKIEQQREWREQWLSIKDRLAALQEAQMMMFFGPMMGGRIAGGGGGEPMNPIVDAEAQSRFRGNPPNHVGRFPAFEMAVIKRLAELNTAQGRGPGENEATNRALRESYTTELRRLGALRAIIQPARNALDAHLTRAEEIYDRVDRSGVPAIDRWVLAGRRKVEGDPNVSALDSIMQEASIEYGRAITGSIQVTEGSRHEAQVFLNSFQTGKQFRAVANEVRNTTAASSRMIDRQMRQGEEELRALGKLAPARPTLKMTDPLYRRAKDVLNYSDARIEQEFGVELVK